MDKVRSIYIELLRILSAFYVFIYHVGSEPLENKTYFSTDKFNKLLGLKLYSAHYFVIIFFVLSGFLITMTASKKTMTFRTFLIARLGRLYSVLIPALIFSYLIAALLVAGNYVPVNAIPNTNNLILRFFLNLTFLTQSWTLFSTPPLNNPFWSVNYEFTYYLLLASALLIKRRLSKFFFILLIAVISGPKILVLLPTWLAGSVLFYCKDKTLSPKLSFVLFIITTMGIFITIINPSIVPLSDSVDAQLFGIPLLFSWNYKSDLVFAILISFNIYFLFGFSNLIAEKLSGNLINSVSRVVRQIGNCTYTLYLFHLPLLFLLASVFPYNKSSGFHQISLIISVLILVYIIAKQTEQKVELWRLFTEKIFELCIKKITIMHELTVRKLK